MRPSSFLLLFSISLFFFNSSFAQKGPQLQALGGGQNTWMFNKMDSDEGDALDYQATFGTQYGVKAGFFFSESVGIETGMLLSKQGQEYKHKVEFLGKETTYHTSRTLTYIKVPVLLHLRSKPDESAYFSAALGPQVSLLNGFSSSSDNKIGKDRWGQEKDYESSVTDIVLAFGPGFSLSDKLKMDLHFRFDYGLTDSEDKSRDIWNRPLKEEERPETHNATGGLQLSVTYAFGG